MADAERQSPITEGINAGDVDLRVLAKISAPRIWVPFKRYDDMLEAWSRRYEVAYRRRRAIAERVRIIGRKMQDHRPAQCVCSRRSVHGQGPEDLH